jgi:hypothetical protein
MSDLSRRVARLERIREIKHRIGEYGVACDRGPYDVDDVTQFWAEDGSFHSGTVFYHGIDEIRRFFDELVADVTTHYLLNPIIDLDASGSTGTACWYGWETPAIYGHSVVGAFDHIHGVEKRHDVWQWDKWVQTIHFLSPADAGWGGENRIVEQSMPSDPDEGVRR